MKVATNPQVREAIKLTDAIINQDQDRHELSGDRETKADLHDSNVMVRLTAHCPQLVITDPVFD